MYNHGRVSDTICVARHAGMRPLVEAETSEQQTAGSLEKRDLVSGR